MKPVAAKTNVAIVGDTTDQGVVIASDYVIMTFDKPVIIDGVESKGFFGELVIIHRHISVQRYSVELNGEEPWVDGHPLRFDSLSDVSTWCGI